MTISTKHFNLHLNVNHIHLPFISNVNLHSSLHSGLSQLHHFSFSRFSRDLLSLDHLSYLQQRPNLNVTLYSNPLCYLLANTNIRNFKHKKLFIQKN